MFNNCIIYYTILFLFDFLPIRFETFLVRASQWLVKSTSSFISIPRFLCKWTSSVGELFTVKENCSL